MSWRVAKALLALRQQVDGMAPARSKAYDGTIGDTTHKNQGSASDHNPWVGPGVVTAMDITDDPAEGCDVAKLAAGIIASRDPRVKYMIHKGRIISDYAVGGIPAWVWRNHGSPANDHFHHLHISVDSAPASYDGCGAWTVTSRVASGLLVKPVGLQVLSMNTKVKALQTAAHTSPDGRWGPATDMALAAVRHYAGRNRQLPWGAKALQRAVGTAQDGIIGQRTQVGVIAAVRAIQRALGAVTDGSWGPNTDKAFAAARQAYYK